MPLLHYKSRVSTIRQEFKGESKSGTSLLNYEKMFIELYREIQEIIAGKLNSLITTKNSSRGVSTIRASFQYTPHNLTHIDYKIELLKNFLNCQKHENTDQLYHSLIRLKNELIQYKGQGTADCIQKCLAIINSTELKSDELIHLYFSIRNVLRTQLLSLSKAKEDKKKHLLYKTHSLENIDDKIGLLSGVVDHIENINFDHLLGSTLNSLKNRLHEALDDSKTYQGQGTAQCIQSCLEFIENYEQAHYFRMRRSASSELLCLKNH